MARSATETTAKPETNGQTPDTSAKEPDKVATKAPEEETPEQYELRRKSLLESLPEEKDRPKNIYARLAQILGLIGQVRKTGENTFHHYKYAKESELVEAIRPILSAYGIWVEQGLAADPTLGIVAHERRSQTKKDREGNITGEVESLTVLTKRFRFVWWNPESKELEKTESQFFMGYGDDTGDKGAYKAETGAVKYFLFKSFMVATGDDPEADDRADRRAAARDQDGATRVDVRRTQRGRSQPSHGGRQQEASKPQIKQLGELLRSAGAANSDDAAALISRLSGVEIKLDEADKAGSLAKQIDEKIQSNPRVIGKLLFDLRKHLEGDKADGAKEEPGAEDKGWETEKDEGDVEEQGGATPDAKAGEEPGEEMEAGGYA